MKKALCIGINNYPGTVNDLQGCINDCLEWRTLLTNNGFDAIVLQNEMATKSNILNHLLLLLDISTEVVLTYSGHGTQVPDINKDEVDGYDEALYVYDGPITDDELRNTIIGYSGKLTVIFDSCFSGTMLRKINETEGTKEESTAKLTPRFYLPEGQAAMPVHLRNIKLLSADDQVLSEEDQTGLLFSGCSDNEYSYDAFIDGEYHGVFTYFATRACRPGYSASGWFNTIREDLPSNRYPQTPQLEGKYADKLHPVFGTVDDTPPADPSEDTPAPVGSGKFGFIGYFAIGTLVLAFIWYVLTVTGVL